jgi:hypothetical protein
VEQWGDDSYGGVALDVVNMDGTVTWRGQGLFWGKGTFSNVGGTYVASTTGVYLSSYVSQGGRTETISGGQFHFGWHAGVDRRPIAICEKKSHHRTEVTTRALREREIIRSNISCNPKQWNSCPQPLCCGKSGVCETARCQNADGYGGGPFCCEDNTPCGGSSHGPYCSAGVFSWEVDAECIEAAAFVDRDEFDQMKRRLEAQLPKAGRHRYSFRENSTIAGDGTGEVLFTEAIEVRDVLTVRHGGVLTNLIDSATAPLVGGGELLVAAGGTHRAGISSRYDEGCRIRVSPRGRMEVPAHATLYLLDTAAVTLDKHSQLHVDGRVLVVRGTGPVAVKQCAAVTGSGAIVGETELRDTCTE